MKDRREKFRKILLEKNKDGILIKGKENKKYIGALTGSGVKVLITKDDIYQIMDGRYTNEAKENTKGFNIVTHSQDKNYIEVVKEILGDKKELCIESSNTLAKEYLKLKKEGFNIDLLEDELEFERRCKDEKEIDLVKKACEITDKVFEECLKEIKVGMKEIELSALIQYLSLKNGASSMAFDTIVASGYRGAMPHGRPTEKEFKKGEFITIDFGVVYKGYQSDMTRTICIGEPSEELRKIYNIVLEAQEKGVQFIKKGVKGKEVDNYVRKIIEDYGYREYFTHGLGHGIGIGGGEFPLLNKRSETILEEGMIMSCEPGIYIPSLGGVRIEDDVAIINGVGVPLNKTTKKLIILEAK